MYDIKEKILIDSQTGADSFTNNTLVLWNSIKLWGAADHYLPVHHCEWQLWYYYTVFTLTFEVFKNRFKLKLWYVKHAKKSLPFSVLLLEVSSIFISFSKLSCEMFLVCIKGLLTEGVVWRTNLPWLKFVALDLCLDERSDKTRHLNTQSPRHKNEK